MTTTHALDRTNVEVVISNEPEQVCGNAVILASLRVEVHVKGDLLGLVDRTGVYSWGLTAGNRKLAERLRACILAGRAFDLATVKVDVNGKRYLSATALLYGRRLNSELKAKGF
jgi:hypothetical protein